MRALASLAAAAFLAGTAAQATTITADAADIMLAWGDIYAETTAPVSADLALTAVYVTGGTGFSPMFGLELWNAGTQLLFTETNDWAFDGDKVLSFYFDIEDSLAALYGDMLTLTFTFADSVLDPFGFDTDIITTAQMSITDNTALPAVPVPATLPLLLGALAAGSALLRRKA